MGIFLGGAIILCGVLSGTISKYASNKRRFIISNICVACIVLSTIMGIGYYSQDFRLNSKRRNHSKLLLDIDPDQEEVQWHLRPNPNAQEFRIEPNTTSGNESTSNSYNESKNQTSTESLALLQERVLDLKGKVGGLNAELQEWTDNQEKDKLIDYLIKCIESTVTYILGLFSPYLTGAVSRKMENKFKTQDESEGES